MQSGLSCSLSPYGERVGDEGRGAFRDVGRRRFLNVARPSPLPSPRVRGEGARQRYERREPHHPPRQRLQRLRIAQRVVVERDDLAHSARASVSVSAGRMPKRSRRVGRGDDLLPARDRADDHQRRLIVRLAAFAGRCTGGGQRLHVRRPARADARRHARPARVEHFPAAELHDVAQQVSTARSTLHGRRRRARSADSRRRTAADRDTSRRGSRDRAGLCESDSLRSRAPPPRSAALSCPSARRARSGASSGAAAAGRWWGGPSRARLGSPLPFWERVRVRGHRVELSGLVPQVGVRSSAMARVDSRAPSPQPSPTRGEGEPDRHAVARSARAQSSSQPVDRPVFQPYAQNSFHGTTPG